MCGDATSHPNSYSKLLMLAMGNGKNGALRDRRAKTAAVIRPLARLCGGLVTEAAGRGQRDSGVRPRPRTTSLLEPSPQCRARPNPIVFTRDARPKTPRYRVTIDHRVCDSRVAGSRGRHIILLLREWKRPDPKTRTVKRQTQGTGPLNAGRLPASGSFPKAEFSPLGRTLPPTRLFCVCLKVVPAAKGLNWPPLYARVTGSRNCSPQPRRVDRGTHSHEDCHERSTSWCRKPISFNFGVPRRSSKSLWKIFVLTSWSTAPRDTPRHVRASVVS